MHVRVGATGSREHEQQQTPNPLHVSNTHTHKQACVDLQNRVWEQLGGDDVDPYALDWYVTFYTCR